MFDYKIFKLFNNLIQKLKGAIIPNVNFKGKKTLILKVLIYIYSFFVEKKIILFQKKRKMNVNEIFFLMNNKTISFNNTHDKISFSPYIPIFQDLTKIFFFKKTRTIVEKISRLPKNFLRQENIEEKRNEFFQMANFFFSKKILLLYVKGFKRMFNFKNLEIDYLTLNYFKKNFRFNSILIKFLGYTRKNKKAIIPRIIEKMLICSNNFNIFFYKNQKFCKKILFFKKKTQTDRINP